MNKYIFIVRFTRCYIRYRSNRYDFRFKTNEQSESCYLTSYLWKINPTWPTRGASRLIEAIDRLSRSQLQRTLARLLAYLGLFSVIMSELTTRLVTQRKNQKYIIRSIFSSKFSQIKSYTSNLQFVCLLFLISVTVHLFTVNKNFRRERSVHLNWTTVRVTSACQKPFFLISARPHGPTFRGLKERIKPAKSFSTREIMQVMITSRLGRGSSP